MTVIEELREYLSHEFMIDFEKDVDDETDLIAEGFIDSFGYLQLLAHLERKYGVNTSDNDANGLVRSLVHLASFVEHRRSA